MTSDGRDPFAALGLDRTANEDEVRRAWRTMAKRAHPDTGGDEQSMQRLNALADEAMSLLAASPPPGTETKPVEDPPQDARRHDVPSFTIEALPVEAFEGLLVAASILGEVADDDPPYSLYVLLDAPLACWCRLDVVPDAGASTVSLSIARAQVDGPDLPDVEQVRDAWVATLNTLDWGELEPR